MTYDPEQYQALIFDCDGTLTDSMETHYIAWRQTMSRHRIDFTHERFYALAGMPPEKIIHLLSDETGTPLDVAEVSHEKEAAFLELIAHVRPFEPVIAIAAAMRGKVPMAVASGGRRESIDAQLRQIGCEDWFNAIVTSEDTERHKPHPDVFLHAAKLMDVPPEGCLVYEDADLGIAAADAAGMDCVDVRQWM